MCEKRYESIAFLVLCCLLFSKATVCMAINVPLSVKERAGIARNNQPVTYGVPFSETDNITSIDNLSISGEDAQFRILSRYNGDISDTTKPIRVVLVDFQGSPDANQNLTYYLTNDGSGNVQSNDLVVLTGSDAVIDTGMIKAIIKSSDSSIVYELWIDSNSNGVYESNEKLIDQPVNDGLIINYESVDYFSGTNRNIMIEENGPMRSVVKIKGSFTGLIPPLGDNDLSYTIRIFAYKNKSYLKVDVTIENENKGWTHVSTDPIHNIYINSCYVKTTLNNLGPKSVTFGSDHTVSNYTTGDLKLIQNETSDGTTQGYSWEYNITKDNILQKQGTQFDSFVNIGNSSNGLMVASRWFWQTHPKAVRVSGDSLYFDIFPDVSNDHRVLGGMWKTHSLLYYFHSGDTDFDDEMAFIKKRLIARCSDTYYAETDFFCSLAPGSFSTSYTFPAGEPLQTAIDEHSESHRALFDSSFIDKNFYQDTIFRRRDLRRVSLDSNTFATWYGWLEFGAIPRASGFGYSSQHYDWSYLALMGFLRFSDYNMFEIAEELVSHKADIIVIHDSSAPTGLDNEYRGGQRYEKDGLFSYKEDYGPYNTAPRKASHLWTKGMALQYMLTGEERYKDSVTQCYEHIVTVKDTAPSTGGETRNQSRGIDALVNGYRLTGNSLYIMHAYDIFNSHLLDKEGGNGTQVGWIKSIANGVWLHYDSIMVEPLIKLHMSLVEIGEPSKADNLKSFLFRWSNWIVNDLFPTWGTNTVGTYINGNTEYFPYKVKIGWKSETKTWRDNSSVDSAYSGAYADLFAYLYTISNNVSLLELARNIFKDYHMYPANGSFQPISLSKKTGGLNSGTPSSGNWKIAKAITKPMFYIKTEWQVSKNSSGGGNIVDNPPGPPAQVQGVTIVN